MDWGLGVLFQYLRSMKNKPEWVRGLIFVAACSLLVFASAGTVGIHSFQAFAEGLWATMQHALAATTIASVASNVAVAAGVPESHPFIPVTNSM